MNKLYELLIKIKQRPSLYLNEKSLARLDALILGYILCQKDYGEENKLFNGFENYIQNKYNISTHNSSQIINFYSFNKDGAFENFFCELEEFLKEHPENLE